MKPALDTYDDMPKYMRKYLQNYGWHFNKALCNYAVSLMTKNGKKLEPLTKEYVDKALEILNANGEDAYIIGTVIESDLCVIIE